MKIWQIGIISIVIIAVIGSGIGYWYFFWEIEDFTNTELHLVFDGEWYRASDGIQEIIEGEVIVSDGEISGSTFADITISPEFPEWINAERELYAHCIVALDDNTIVQASFDDQIGEVKIFPEGTWVVSVIQDDPDRWAVWKFTNARDAMSICRNAETTIAPNINDIPEDEWFVPVDDAVLRFDFTN